MKLSDDWKSRKLWTFIGISTISCGLATLLLITGYEYPILLDGKVVMTWKSHIDMGTWGSIIKTNLTVGLGIFVVGNVVNHYINGKNGK